MTAAALPAPPAGAWSPPSRLVTVGGATVRVATWGQGPPLLLLNGIGGNLEMWEPLAEHLRGRRLVLVDMPGAGGSPPLRVPLRLPGYARLLVRLLDHLGLERVDVLGYSWGGTVAQELARTAPARVRSLVLAATTPGLGGRPPAPWVFALMLTPARYYSRTYLRLIGPVVFGSRAGADTDGASGQARRRKPPTVLGYSQQMYAISGWSSRGWLATLDLPTLVVAGSRDPLVPARNAEILAERIPGARRHTVDGGHLFLLEQPAEAAVLVQAFLAEQDAGRGGAGAAQSGTRSRT